MYIERLIAEFKNSPQQTFVGLCVFFVAVMGTSVHHVASIGYVFLVLFGLYIIRDWGNIWKQLAKYEKVLLVSLGLYVVSGVVAFVNVQDTSGYFRMFERYFRFFLAIPIYLVIRKYQISVINYLYVGAVVSGPFLFCVAFYAYFENPNDPAHGHYHHIIFGSIAMLNVGVMLAILLMEKMAGYLKLIVFLSMICGLVAVVLSQSRGVWLVIPLYILIILYYSFKHSFKRFVGVVGVISILSIALFVSPVGDMVQKRVDVAVNEVSNFYNKNDYMSSLGTRLAMWNVAVDVWKEHPILGTGPGDFDDVILDLQANGNYVGMNVFLSTHNIYMQALVNAGLFGLLAMVFALFIVPMWVLVKYRKKSPVNFLTGVAFILLFATVGLSESWTLRLPAVSVFIVYLVVIISSMNLTKKAH